MESDFFNKPGFFGFSLADRIEQALTGVAVGVGMMFAAPTTLRKMSEPNTRKCDDVGSALYVLGVFPTITAMMPAAAVINPYEHSFPFAREILTVQLATQTLSQAYETIRYFANNFTIQIKRRAVGNGT